MDINLTVIIDNMVYVPGLRAEHGFCLFIETEEHKLLFDTGQSSLFIENSLKMGIELMDISKIVISHGHYDHTGGLLSLLEYAGKEIDVYAHPVIFEKKYSGRDREKTRYIGIPENRSIYEELGARFLMVDKPLEIEKNIFISGQIPRSSGFESVEEYFIKIVNGDYIHDDIPDDISLAVRTGEGNILVTGCAHSGLINTIDYAEQFTGVKEFKFICGGFHLSNRTEEQNLVLLKYLKKKNFGYIAPAHCTGAEATCLIKNQFGPRFLKSGVGVKFEFGISGL